LLAAPLVAWKVAQRVA